MKPTFSQFLLKKYHLLFYTYASLSACLSISQHAPHTDKEFSHSDDLASSLPVLFHWHPNGKCTFPKQKHSYITVNIRCSWFYAYHFVLVAYETKIHTFTDFIDSLYIGDRTLQTVNWNRIKEYNHSRNSPSSLGFIVSTQQQWYQNKRMHTH